MAVLAFRSHQALRAFEEATAWANKMSGQRGWEWRQVQVQREAEDAVCVLKDWSFPPPEVLAHARAGAYTYAHLQLVCEVRELRKNLAEMRADDDQSAPH